MKKAVIVGLVMALGISIGGFAVARAVRYDAAETTQKVIDELRQETLMQSEDLQVRVSAQSTPDQKVIDELHKELLEVVDLRGLYGHS